MQSTPQKNTQAVMLGQRGGCKRAEQLTAEQRSAISRHAARSRWHPKETRAAKEKAQKLAYLIQQALKDDRQLPFV